MSIINRNEVLSVKNDACNFALYIDCSLLLFQYRIPFG